MLLQGGRGFDERMQRLYIHLSLDSYQPYQYADVVRVYVFFRASDEISRATAKAHTSYRFGPLLISSLNYSSHASSLIASSGAPTKRLRGVGHPIIPKSDIERPPLTSSRPSA
jgi:hypothetical protein